MAAEHLDRIDIQIRGILDLPCKRRDCCGIAGVSCKRRAPQEITVTVQEIAPSRKDEHDVPLPATYCFGGIRVGEDGLALYDEKKRPFTKVHCVKGWRLRFNASHTNGKAIGSAEIDALDLQKKKHWRLLLSTDNEDAVYRNDATHVRCPSWLVVFVNSRNDYNADQHIPRHLPRNQRDPRPRKEHFKKRVMIMTRGTRGDVQPYIALARGLASKPFNCEVTIVTEICWKSLIVEQRRGMPEGSIHFRPSGGNTMLQTQSYVALTALHLGQHVDTLQSLFLCKSEQNFFSSEGCFYYWAEQERPDFIVFAFTVTHLAMIISEALRIPIVGFFLQPMREIDPRPKTGSIMEAVLNPVRGQVGGPEFNAFLTQVLESIPEAGVTINRLRKTRKLGKFPSGIYSEFLHYNELKRQRASQIVPINPLVLGTDDAKLKALGMETTDFIFLRCGSDKLPDEMELFIKKAKDGKKHVIVMAFSSMPVGEAKMLQLAVHICNRCAIHHQGEQHKPALIAFVKGQEFDPLNDSKDPNKNFKLQEDVKQLIDEGRLLKWNGPGVPFGDLFSKVDAVITQGGLGTTSEALLAGIPPIISGILLMDQRYWAGRIQELEGGPGGQYIDQLLERKDHEWEGVRVLKQALNNNPDSWKNKAKDIQRKMQEVRKGRECQPDGALQDISNEERQELNKNLCEDDGVALNAYKVFEAGCSSRYLENSYSEQRRCCMAERRTCETIFYCLKACFKCILFRQVPGLAICLLRMVSRCGLTLVVLSLGGVAGFGAAQLVLWTFVLLWEFVLPSLSDLWWTGIVYTSVFFTTWILVGLLVSWCINRKIQQCNAVQPDVQQETLESFESFTPLPDPVDPVESTCTPQFSQRVESSTSTPLIPQRVESLELDP